MQFENLASLALFAEVARLRSFSEAARQAGIAKSAVSKRIARLEDELGVRLLRRSTRTLSLTDEGVRVYEHCAAIVAAAAAAESSARSASEELRGTIRINAPVTFAHMHLARALAPFLAGHPGIAIDLATDDRYVDVIDSGYDIIIRVGRLRDSGLYAKKLVSDRLVIVASPAYLARAGTPEAPGDLVRHDCLHYTLVPMPLEWRFRGANGQPLHVPVRGTLTATDGAVLRAASLAGIGIAVLPSFMVADDLAHGRLVTLLDPFRRAEIGIHAMLAHRTGTPRRIRALLDHLVDHFKRTRVAAL